MAAAATVLIQILQRRAAIRFWAVSLRRVEDTAELETVNQPTAVLAVVADGMHLLKESLLESPVRVIRVAVVTALDTVLVVAAVVLVVSVEERAVNTLVEMVVLE